ncbi:MAG: diguanylate cyclase [Candidatus Riflebacteria bacterium]|nr:diguanylate cyclase [Candidatus Riflebacteria bacterium]
MEEAIPLHHSLKFKFVLGIIILVGIILTLTLATTSKREDSLINEGIDQSGMLLSSTLALACQDPIIRQTYDDLTPYVERIISAGENVIEISIIDQDGKILAFRSRRDQQNRLGVVLPSDEFEKYSSLESPCRMPVPLTGRYIEYASPIRIGSSPFGTVILKYSCEPLDKARLESRKEISFIGIIALLLGVIFSFGLAKFVTRTLDSLMKGTLIVSAGDLSYRLEIESHDEIGMLAGRFNEMILALESNQKALDRKIFEIETLFKASQTMNFQNDTDKLIKQILEMACKALKSERASIMLQTDGKDELSTKIVYGAQTDTTTPATITTIKAGEGVAGTVFKTGTSIIVNDGANDPLFKSYETSTNFEHLIRNLISVPLKARERATGVINVTNKLDPVGFNSDDQRLLEALAQQAAMAVEHARLYELAITDGLTKLFIHRYFQARLEEEILRAKRYHTTVSLILMDIDHFKKFNDTYGHQQGDIVLVEVAKLVKQTLRETIDIPARYGGEEFTVILPETDASGAQLVAERLRRIIESYDFPGQGKPLKVTISLGIATFPDHASNRPMLIKKADMALYHCKKRGRNCSTIFNDTITEDA